MTHRIVVDVQTGEVTQVEFTAEEQAAYDAAIATQNAEQPVIDVSVQEVVSIETPAETFVKNLAEQPTNEV
jgi:hypothetical protein